MSVFFDFKTYREKNHRFYVIRIIHNFHYIHREEMQIGKQTYMLKQLSVSCSDSRRTSVWLTPIVWCKYCPCCTDS